jgi:hypothetical protein
MGQHDCYCLHEACITANSLSRCRVTAAKLGYKLAASTVKHASCINSKQHVGYLKAQHGGVAFMCRDHFNLHKHTPPTELNEYVENGRFLHVSIALDGGDSRSRQ